MAELLVCAGYLGSMIILTVNQQITGSTEKKTSDKSPSLRTPSHFTIASHPSLLNFSAKEDIRP